MATDRRQAFETETLPHMPELFGMAVRLTGSRDDAEDLVQETFLRAYRTYGNFESGTNARAWLFTILRSIWINRSGRAKRSPEAMTVSDLEQRRGREIELVDDEAHGRVLANPKLKSSPTEIERAIAGLPEAFRMPLLLVDVGELTYGEAARVLDCPVGTVRSRLSRARKALASALIDAGGRPRRRSS